ncbi:hypothetical protein P8888_23370, partial [Bacillus haynesii]|nr:hypothetical protein [Bacillus haynesii]
FASATPAPTQRSSLKTKNGMQGCSFSHEPRCSRDEIAAVSMKAAPTAEMVNASNVISGKIGKRCASCTPFFSGATFG